jgi:predicted naringenin-chalcone synthase
MTLSGYVPELIGADFQPLVRRALDHFGMPGEFVPDGWCIHPGGKRILQAVERSLALRPEALKDSYEVLRKYGNMSSPSILFVLKAMMEKGLKGNIIGAAFGPGLTMETCWREAGEP